ncbi:MAG: DUF4293 family protein [Bacteroidia bacterium]|nr:DUF4293 family protein [Bacteroidia bacterium]
MIQRIQTVYLLVAALLTASLYKLKFADLSVNGELYVFNAQGISNAETLVFNGLPILIFIGLIALLHMAIIFMYKKRIRQIRVAVFTIVLLLGLFGTVIAVIGVVQAINDHAPLVQTIHLTGGLMSALACTAAGLLVALAGHVMYTILIVRIERIVLEMESAASEIVAFLTQENPKA